MEPADLFFVYMVLSHVCMLPSGVTDDGDSMLSYYSALSAFIELKENSNLDFGRIPQSQNGGSVQVSISMNINNILDIKESEMEFTIDCYFRQYWRDPRLSFNFTGLGSIAIPDRYYEDIWLPDTYIENGKDELLHTATMVNKMFRLYTNGSVVYSLRLKLTIWCALSLHHFPLDTQYCTMDLYSYRYTTNEVALKWDKESPIYFPNGNASMSSFELINTAYDEFDVTLVTGTFGCARANFTLRRHYGYYMTQVYVPSILIVMLSWISFWLAPDAVPARISLGILTILAMTNQLSAVASSSLPEVSYIISMDIWLMVCMGFLCLAVVEFAIVNSLERAHLKEHKSAYCKKHADVEMAYSISYHGNGVSPCQPYRGGRHPEVTSRHQQRGPNFALKTDLASRVLFPFAFFLFNVAYWVTYV